MLNLQQTLNLNNFTFKSRAIQSILDNNLRNDAITIGVLKCYHGKERNPCKSAQILRTHRAFKLICTYVLEVFFMSSSLLSFLKKEIFRQLYISYINFIFEYN